MTAVLYDEVVAVTSAPRLRVVPDPAPTAPATPETSPTTSNRLDPRLMGADPLLDGAARLLCIPLRQLYAALWRVGVIEVSA